MQRKPPAEQQKLNCSPEIPKHVQREEHPGCAESIIKHRYSGCLARIRADLLRFRTYPNSCRVCMVITTSSIIAESVSIYRGRSSRSPIMAFPFCHSNSKTGASTLVNTQGVKARPRESATKLIRSMPNRKVQKHWCLAQMGTRVYTCIQYMHS